MAFTTPATAVALTVLTAGWLNTYVRDNMAWMATDSPSCRSYSSIALTTTTSVTLALLLNSERFDNAAMHSTSVNTSRITIPTGGGGKYLMGVGMEFTANATGVRIGTIFPNGLTATPIASDARSTASAGTTRMTLCASYALAAAEYIESGAFQSSGGNLTVTTADLYSPEFWAIWFRT